MAQEQHPGNVIQKIHIDPQAKPHRKLTIPGGELMPTQKLYWSGEAIRTPEGSVAVEDFAPGSTINWFFEYTEAHYIVSGKAKVTYRLGPLFLEEKSFDIVAGDVYVIPKGAMMQWKVDAAGPLRKLCVIMPGFRLDLVMAGINPEVRGRAFQEGKDLKYD